jgi:hypothetical protein
MRQTLWAAWAGVLTALAGGCMALPAGAPPALLVPDPAVTVENPLFVPLGPWSDPYNHIFETALDVVGEYFEVSYSNRYDGRIETFPRISPGLEQPWKPGSPDCYQRLEATLQSMRRRAIVLIQPAEDGGYFIEVTVYKELEDLPQPTRMLAGGSAFRTEPTVERQFEVIDAAVFESNWIPKGRDAVLEQLILQRLRKCM